jgi:hypothetical protein
MADFGNQFCLTLITDDPVLAAAADQAGVNRIGLDLEVLGKAERQSGEDTRLSKHKIESLPIIARSLAKADLFVRLNPMNANSQNEIETALRFGAKVLMLPFFRTADEVSSFVRLVAKRAYVIILVETASAAVRLRDILAVPGVDEVMFGLNDLRMELGVRNHFEVLASPLLDAMASEVRRARLILSLGGVARPDDVSLPVSPDLILAQFPRLGATGAWVSRSFFRGVPPDWELPKAIAAVRQRLTEWAATSPECLERARADLAEQARDAALRPTIRAIDGC